MDVDKSSALDFSETIEVKVVDKSENLSTVDSYFFAYFQELEAALEQIRDAVRTYSPSSENLPEATVIDTTGTKSFAAFPPTSHSQDEPLRPGPTGFRLSSLWRPWSDVTSPNRPIAPILEVDTADDFTHVSKRKTSFIPITSSPERMTPPPLLDREPSDHLANDDSSQHPTPIATTSPNHTYPPSNSIESSSSGSSLSSWGRPSWLRIPSRRPFSVHSGNSTAVAEHPTTSLSSGGIADALTSALSRGSKLIPDLGFSVLDSPDGQVEQEIQDKFRQAFAFDENEKVLGCKLQSMLSHRFEVYRIYADFPGHLLRLFPISGRLYVSENYFCFKSSGALALRTKVRALVFSNRTGAKT
jgi:sterol 3beta-glucosyltransferase